MFSPHGSSRASKIVLATVATGTLVFASYKAYSYWDEKRRTEKTPKMSTRHPFETVFAVPMHCDSCVKDISATLHKVQGVTKVDADLANQLVSITGTAAPSQIVEAIQAGGRDAILRGSGASNNAAVSILETFFRPPGHDSSQPEDEDIHRDVRGLARMVQVSPDTTLVDLTLRGVAPGTYTASIREYGNLSRGASTTGPVWGTTEQPSTSSSRRGVLGTVKIGADGRGAAFLDREFKVWEVIGRAMVVTRQGEGKELENDENTLVGVVARSAGVWDNDKTVCSCTGKTLWEERKDEVKKGML